MVKISVTDLEGQTREIAAEAGLSLMEGIRNNDFDDLAAIVVVAVVVAHAMSSLKKAVLLICLKLKKMSNIFLRIANPIKPVVPAFLAKSKLTTAWKV